MSAARPFRLGVLFVHGIGLQPSGETLVRWGDRLIDVIACATRGAVAARIDRADLGDASGKGPTTAELRLSADGGEERWLLCEGWWAEAFPAPRYGELVSWSVRALPWSIAIHIAQRYWQTASPDRVAANILPAVRALAQLVVALLLAPFLIALLAVALVLGALPIPQLRAWILAAQSALTATIGDSLAFVDSPVRAALIRTRILDRLEALERVSDRTIVLAHSQGAAAVLDALGGIGQGGDEADAPAAPRPRIVPDALVTFGAGTNQLASHKVLSAVLTTKMRHNPAATAVWALLVLAGVCGWLYASIRMQRTTAFDIVLTAGLWFAVILTFSAIAFGAVRLIGKVTARLGWSARAERRALVASVTALLLATMGPAMWYVDRAGLPFGTVNLLVAAVLIALSSLILLLKRDMQTVLTAVRKPPGLKEWIDIYASADPVPNGPTMMRDRGEARSIRIWNRGSILTDHTSYWDNRDGFVLRAVRACAAAAGSGWLGLLPAENDYLDERARWRVRWLRMAHTPAVLGILTAGAAMGSRHRAALTLPVDVPGWIPPAAAQWMAAGGMTVAAAWAVSRLVAWVWHRWVRAEQDLSLRHELPRGTPSEYLGGLGIVAWMSIIAAYAAIRAEPLAPLLEDPESLLMLPIMALGFTLISGALLLKLVPPPRPGPAQAPRPAGVADS